MMVGSRPMFSITSISPHCGQPAASMSAPNIQKAGQIPCPCGIWRRVSNFRRSREAILGLSVPRRSRFDAVVAGETLAAGGDYERAIAQSALSARVVSICSSGLRSRRRRTS